MVLDSEVNQMYYIWNSYIHYLLGGTKRNIEIQFMMMRLEEMLMHLTILGQILLVFKWPFQRF